MENPVIIFGANYIGRAAKEIFDGNDVAVFGFLDDDRAIHKTEIDDVVVLGSTDDDRHLKLIGKKCEAFIAVDDNRVRKALVKMLQDKRHVQPINAIHRQSHVSSRAVIGHGNFIDIGVSIAPGVTLGGFCVLHAKATVAVGVRIGNYVQIGSGSLINAGVTIEDEVFIGSGVTVVAGILIGKGARIGAGSVVVSAVSPGVTLFGNPAQPVKT